MRRVLGQVGQITFEKDLDLQVEMAVMDQLGNVFDDGKRIVLAPKIAKGDCWWLRHSATTEDGALTVTGRRMATTMISVNANRKRTANRSQYAYRHCTTQQLHDTFMIPADQRRNQQKQWQRENRSKQPRNTQMRGTIVGQGIDAAVVTMVPPPDRDFFICRVHKLDGVGEVAAKSLSFYISVAFRSVVRVFAGVTTAIGHEVCRRDSAALGVGNDRVVSGNASQRNQIHGMLDIVQ
ncbi:hypothetical protein LSAT2_025967 [Lamellibrachia satsuma]|nr:hypothetical protein LSAT2_025967 [Lamellibrachia satsuma]